jgi:Glycosyl hydrolase family 9./N-terminal ig-like domain of cellulase.
MNNQLQAQLEESRYIRRPMKEETKYGAYEKWQKKPVEKSLALPLAAHFNALINHDLGTLHIDHEVTHSTLGSIRVDAPTSTAVKNPTNRRYAEAGFRYPMETQDLSAYNRISFWAYVNAPGINSQLVAISLHNEGAHIMPAPGRFDGTHHADITPGEWTQVIWEIPDIYRDQVSGFSIYTLLHGSPVYAAEQLSLYIDDLRIEKVSPDKTRGFALPKGEMAYCHSGYLGDARKHALVQNCSAAEFSLLNEKAEAVYTNKVQTTGEFQLLDFSVFADEGTYTLRVGDIVSNPFVIGNDAFLSAAWKSVNFFLSERCGCDVPGIHTECHLDAFCRHPDGRTLPVHGGWHDAADMSQSIDKTADVVVAMLDLAQATQKKQPLLSDRVLEEARWGLNWIMRTRFGDGYRYVSMVKSIWTKNMRGDKDDMTCDAQNTAVHNYTAAYTCAYAADFFKWDKVFSKWCLECAAEDFFFAEEMLECSKDNSLLSERIALAVSAGAMLYRVTGEERFLDAAAMRAQQLAQCQQLERRNDFSIPLHGFFYEDREKSRPIGFYHRSYEHFFVKGFLLLLKNAPNHADAPLWKKCVDAYKDYICETAHAMAPYDILPAGVYEIDNVDYSKISHEGPRNQGAPTLEEYNAQVRAGIPLNEMWYLRRFPVAYQFRGFHTTLLSKAKNVFELARYENNRELYDLAVRQLEYVLGFNPFACSTMYGEGYDYPLLYGGLLGRQMGAVPVGFQTFENDDEPYMPMQNNCTYKEVWVCSTARVMWSIAYAYMGKSF